MRATDPTGLGPKKELEKKIQEIHDQHAEKLKEVIADLEKAQDDYVRAADDAENKMLGGTLLGALGGAKAGAKFGVWGAAWGALFGATVGLVAGLAASTSGLRRASEDLDEAEDAYEKALNEESEAMLKEIDEAIDEYNDVNNDDVSYPVHIDNLVTGQTTWHQVGADK